MQQKRLKGSKRSETSISITTISIKHASRRGKPPSVVHPPYEKEIVSRRHFLTLKKSFEGLLFPHDIQIKVRVWTSTIAAGHSQQNRKTSEQINVGKRRDRICLYQLNLQLTSGKSLAGHDLNRKVGVLGIPVRQEAKASRQARRGIHLQLDIVQRPEALEDVLELGGSDVPVDIAQIDLLGDLAPPSYGGDGGTGNGRARNGGRGSRHGGSSVCDRRPTGGAWHDASTGRHGTTELALESLGDGTAVVLLGLAALHEDGETLEVRNLRAELESGGDVGEVGHLDVGAALVPAGALVAEEDDVPDATGLPAEVVPDVALVGLHDQLRHKDGSLLLGERICGIETIRAGRARSSVAVVMMMTTTLVGWIIAGMWMSPVVMVVPMSMVVVTRFAAPTVRSVTIAAAARALPVMTVFRPRPGPGARARRTTRRRRVGTLALASAAVLGGLVGTVLGWAGGRRLVGLLLLLSISSSGAAVVTLALVVVVVGGTAVGDLGCFGGAAAGPRSGSGTRPRRAATAAAPTATSGVGPRSGPRP